MSVVLFLREGGGGVYKLRTLLYSTNDSTINNNENVLCNEYKLYIFPISVFTFCDRRCDLLNSCYN